MGTRSTLVLLVDDEPVVRMVTAAGLEDAGFQVIEASSAAGALEAMALHPAIGVLFTDVNMPGDLDGMDLARAVHDRWPNVRIVVTSGQARPSEPIPDQGRFLAKPYSIGDAAELVKAISSPRK